VILGEVFPRLNRVQGELNFSSEGTDHPGEGTKRQVLFARQDLAYPASRNTHGLGKVSARDLMLAHIPGQLIDNQAGEIDWLAPVIFALDGSRHTSHDHGDLP
jgi:hypothetical protein